MGQGPSYTLIGPSTLMGQWRVHRGCDAQSQAFDTLDLATDYIREQSVPPAKATAVRLIALTWAGHPSPWRVTGQKPEHTKDFAELAEATWYARCLLLGERYVPAAWKSAQRGLR